MSGVRPGERPGGGIDVELVDLAGATDVVTELRLRLVAVEAARAATRRVLQPSFVEFLGKRQPSA